VAGEVLGRCGEASCRGDGALLVEHTCPQATSWDTNAAWLALTVMAHNLGRAVGQLAGPDLNTATAATLCRKVFTTPGRLVHSGRRRRLRLPDNWPWATAITAALNTITAIPMRC
jgi:hypothetical protein